jgi:hypothetical protein
MKKNIQKWGVRQATSDEVSNWNSLIVQNPDGGSSLQTSTFIENKCAEGAWKSIYMVFESGSLKVYSAFLWRNVPFLGKVFYAPYGPGVTDTDSYYSLRESITASDQFKGAFVIYCEPRIISAVRNRQGETTRNINYIQEGLGQIRPRRLQIGDTVLTDLNDPRPRSNQAAPDSARRHCHDGPRNGRKRP